MCRGLKQRILNWSPNITTALSLRWTEKQRFHSVPNGYDLQFWTRNRIYWGQILFLISALPVSQLYFQRSISDIASIWMLRSTLTMPLNETFHQQAHPHLWTTFSWYHC